MDRKEISEMLKNYKWMVNSIKIMRQSLNLAGEGLIAQYGIESAMPKAKGTTGDPIYREFKRRERRLYKVQELEEKILEFQSLFYLIHDERESEILYWLLDGKSYRWIADHMGLSFSHIRRIRETIVDKMANGTNGTNGTDHTDLLNEEKCG